MVQTETSQTRVLLIEDERPVRKLLSMALAGDEYEVLETATGQEGLEAAARQSPDIIILDLGLPDIDGLEVIQRLRAWSSTPLIVLSARNKEQDKVAALDAGADDYLSKPFSVPELEARMRAARRHAARTAAPQDAIFSVGELHINFITREVILSGNRVKLTRTEYRIMEILAKHAGKALTHRQLLLEAVGQEASDDVHYLRVYIHQLRQKLEVDPANCQYILTENGVGYRLRATM